MTPTAVTPAARSKRSDGSANQATEGARGESPARVKDGAAGAKRPSSPHSSTPRSAHRTARSGAGAPSAPRRVSGPARPSSTERPSSTTRPSSTARSSAPPRPKRRSRTTPRTAVSEGRTARAPRARRQSVPRQSLRVRGLAFARSLPDHSLLDRLIRSRIWIPLLGVLLVGIVASQVEILKLNASLGHNVVRAAQLQSEDQRLANAVSQMSDVQRIESRAAHMGLSMPAAYTPVFLSGGRGELRRALSDIHKPDPAAFEARAAALAAHRAALVQSSSGA